MTGNISVRTYITVRTHVTVQSSTTPPTRATSQNSHCQLKMNQFQTDAWVNFCTNCVYNIIQQIFLVKIIWWTFLVIPSLHYVHIDGLTEFTALFTDVSIHHESVHPPANKLARHLNVSLCLCVCVSRCLHVCVCVCVCICVCVSVSARVCLCGLCMSVSWVCICMCVCMCVVYVCACACMWSVTSRQ